MAQYTGGNPACTAEEDVYKYMTEGTTGEGIGQLEPFQRLSKKKKQRHLGLKKNLDILTNYGNVIFSDMETTCLQYLMFKPGSSGMKPTSARLLALQQLKYLQKAGSGTDCG